MYARVAQEPGRARLFLVLDAVRAPRKKMPRLVGVGPADGSEQDRRQGSAKRRQRSAARWQLSRRSRPIVPMSAGNSPQRTRGREAADRSKTPSGGTDAADLGLPEHLNTTAEERGVGETSTTRMDRDPLAACFDRWGRDRVSRRVCLDRGAGCLNWARPDLWEPRASNRPRPPGAKTV